MNRQLHKPTVLVLNRNWQAINVRTPAEAFCQMATDVATALNIDGESMFPVKWSDWLKLPIREQDVFVSTPRGRVRVPTVIVLANYAKVPRKRPKFSARGIWTRDGRRCQYTGKFLEPQEGNIDHVIPRSRGGKTNWENCVLASKAVNTRKGDRLPSEIGLKLLREPTIPRELPATLFIRNSHGVPDWEHFLVK